MPGEPEHVNTQLDKMIKGKKSITLQTRVRRPWKTPEEDVHGGEEYTETHLLLALHPDVDDTGAITTVMSCITDISGLKWSESQLRRRMDQAIEMKRQQERFIDVS